jgi:hypothetical protein
MPWLEAVLGERVLQGLPQAVGLGTIGLVPFAEVGAQLAGGVVQRGPGPAAAVGCDRAWTSKRAASSYSRGGTVTMNSQPDGA